jgi:hypothetical protein
MMRSNPAAILGPMWGLFWWSVGIGVAAVVLPPAMYLTIETTPLVVLVIGTSLVSWGVLFGRAWYLFGKPALWTLLSLPLALMWPSFFLFLLISCTYTGSCL